MSAPTVDLADFAEVSRNRWGQPLITPAGGGKPIAYTRVSTLAKTLDDGSGLAVWKQRMTAVGLSRRDDLIMLAKSCDPGDTKTLGSIVKQAMEAAESGAAANRGTALHSFTEAIDAGREHQAPAEYAADLDAYVTATSGLDMVMAEGFVVCDFLQAAGSFDRLVRMPNGDTVIADLKTGKSPERYALATSAQVATYANSVLYNPATGERTDLPGPVNKSVGLLIALTAGTGVCTIHKLDLDLGWHVAKTATAVRALRKENPAQLLWSS